MPIPSPSWCPSSLQERAAWFQNFADNLPLGLATNLGFTAAEHAAIMADNEDFQHIAATQLSLDSFAKAYREYRISVCEDPVGTPQPMFPIENFTPPPNDVPAGIFQRLIENVDRIRAAAAYTDELGASLRIIPRKPEPQPESELKPVIKAEANPIGEYRFTVNVTRLGQPAYKVQIQRMNSDQWTDTIVATGNPTDVTISPLEPGQTERILVRAILYKGSQAIGQPSDPTYVTVGP